MGGPRTPRTPLATPLGTKMCRLAQCWFRGLAVPNAKILEHNIRKQFYQAALLWFEISKMLIAVSKNKFIVSFIITFGTLSFPHEKSYVSETASRQYLRSAASHQLTVPSHRRVPYGGRTFVVAGPSGAGFKCVEALGRIIVRGPCPPLNAIVYMHFIQV